MDGDGDGGDVEGGEEEGEGRGGGKGKVEGGRMNRSEVNRPEKRPSEALLGPGRLSDSHRSSAASAASVSSPFVPSILGANGGVTGLGVDPKKVVQFEDLPEPPPHYGVVPEHSEEISEVLGLCVTNILDSTLPKLDEVFVCPRIQEDYAKENMLKHADGESVRTTCDCEFSD
ncbi:unnamed protein product [Hydatigera taeniaeformis]|uniref:Protein-serine/threonine phosphatase n=1 Tax=Hydatigena taeniaeformis TaxID=6205 RepID=A0A0R3WJJ1_HYDTA|nr:unnamed protein product [Hydatigera taeniaeformis]